MQILFICGSLETGRDGVGDYTRRLAGELISLGHTAAALAYNDPFVFHETWETQIVASIEIEVLRLPIGMPYNRKLTICRQWLKVLKPNWLSLQYVPFAYQQKGLPFQLSSQLKKLGKGHKWHIMFHELWTGMKVGTPLKEYVLGKLQQVLIFAMLKSLKPTVVHTQSMVYQAQLMKRRINAAHLPLFGNIPLIPTTKINRANDKIQLVLFGGIHPGACIDELIGKLQHYIHHTGKQVEIVFIGRNGAELKVWKSALQNSSIIVTVVGEQSAEKISAWFQLVDAGLFTTPAILAEKSGSVAAMLEHGLKVICVQENWVAKGLEDFKPELPVYELKKIDFEDFFQLAPLLHYDLSIASIARQFIESLKV